MPESREWWKDPEAQAYLADAQRNLLPKVHKARVTLALWSGSVDAKNALELGFMVALDKPIILLVTPGTKVPRKLALVADEIVECDDPRDPTVQERLAAAMKRLGVD
jgi:nucleoside 2-deoxyribosyltransferase